MTAAGGDLLAAATDVAQFTVGEGGFDSRRGPGAGSAGGRFLDELADEHIKSPMRRILKVASVRACLA